MDVCIIRGHFVMWLKFVYFPELPHETGVVQNTVPYSQGDVDAEGLFVDHRGLIDDLIDTNLVCLNQCRSEKKNGSDSHRDR